MDARELSFWLTEARWSNNVREASMADAMRYGYNADANAYGRYVRELRARPEQLRQSTGEERKAMWDNMKAKGRG